MTATETTPFEDREFELDIESFDREVGLGHATTRLRLRSAWWHQRTTNPARLYAAELDVGGLISESEIEGLRRELGKLLERLAAGEFRNQPGSASIGVHGFT